MCPVTREPLGSHPIEVDTGLGKALKQPLWKKLFGQKPAKGVTIYVCCQDCAAKVRSSPGEYFLKVLDEKNHWGKRTP